MSETPGDALTAEEKARIAPFVTDVDGKLDKMSADLTKVAADRAKLVADLSA